jgi:serine/threonine protein kinase
MSKTQDPKKKDPKADQRNLKRNTSTHHATTSKKTTYDVDKDFKLTNDDNKPYNIEELNKYLQAYNDATFSKEKSIAYVLTNFLRSGSEESSKRYKVLETEFFNLRKNYSKVVDAYTNAFENWANDWEKKIKEGDDTIEVLIATQSVIEATSMSQGTTLLSASNAEKYTNVINDYKMNPDLLKKDKKLGEGGFGVVYTASFSEDGKPRWTVAIKEMKQDTFKVDIIKECAILKDLQNENVVEFYGIISIGDGTIKLVMEFCEKGSLQSLIFGDEKEKEKIPPSRKYFMALEVAEALRFVHANKYLHLDLKPSNILITKHYNTKLADFGMSQSANQNNQVKVGTAMYMAPEIWKEEGVSAAADVYSFGLVLYALFLEQQPFETILGKSTDEFWKEKLRDEVTFPKTCPKNLKELVSSLTKSEATDRPSLEEIVKNNYLIDLLNGNEKFKSIWEQNFKDRESIHLIEFIIKFFEKYEVKPPPLANIRKSVVYKCFKSIMTKSSSMIGPSDVERFVKLMSPLDESAEDIIRKAKDLLSDECFWGQLTEDDAKVILAKSKHNKTYIIRFSVTEQGRYAISYTKNKGKKIQSQRVDFKDIERYKEKFEELGFTSKINTKDLYITSYHHVFKYDAQDTKAELLPPEYQYAQTAYLNLLEKSQSLEELNIE